MDGIKPLVRRGGHDRQGDISISAVIGLREALGQSSGDHISYVAGGKTFTVANSGADFTTVWSALQEAAKWRAIGGEIVVQIASGYTIAEQLVFRSGSFSHVIISGSATVDGQALTETFFGGVAPVFAIINCSGPTLRVRINAVGITQTAPDATGVYVEGFQGNCAIDDSSQLEGFKHGVYSYGGTITGGRFCTIKDNSHSNIYCQNGVVTVGDDCWMSGAGYAGVYCFDGSVKLGSRCDMYESDIGLFSLNGSISTGYALDLMDCASAVICWGGRISVGEASDLSGSWITSVDCKGGEVIIAPDCDLTSSISVFEYSLYAHELGTIKYAGSGGLEGGKEANQAPNILTIDGLIMSSMLW